MYGRWSRVDTAEDDIQHKLKSSNCNEIYILQNISIRHLPDLHYIPWILGLVPEEKYLEVKVVEMHLDLEQLLKTREARQESNCSLPNNDPVWWTGEENRTNVKIIKCNVIYRGVEIDFTLQTYKCSHSSLLTWSYWCSRSFKHSLSLGLMTSSLFYPIITALQLHWPLTHRKSNSAGQPEMLAVLICTILSV